MPAIKSSPTMGDPIMHGEPVGSATCPSLYVTIHCPDSGVIRVESAALFADPDSLLCRRFVGRVLLAPEIELRFDTTLHSPRGVLGQVAALLDAAPNGDPAIEVPPALTARDRRGAIRYYRYGQRATGW